MTRVAKPAPQSPQPSRFVRVGALVWVSALLSFGLMTHLAASRASRFSETLESVGARSLTTMLMLHPDHNNTTTVQSSATVNATTTYISSKETTSLRHERNDCLHRTCTNDTVKTVSKAPQDFAVQSRRRLLSSSAKNTITTSHQEEEDCRNVILDLDASRGDLWNAMVHTALLQAWHFDYNDNQSGKDELRLVRRQLWLEKMMDRIQSSTTSRPRDTDYKKVSQHLQYLLRKVKHSSRHYCYYGQWDELTSLQALIETEKKFSVGTTPHLLQQVRFFPTALSAPSGLDAQGVEWTSDEDHPNHSTTTFYGQAMMRGSNVYSRLELDEGSSKSRGGTGTYRTWDGHDIWSVLQHAAHQSEPNAVVHDKKRHDRRRHFIVRATWSGTSSDEATTQPLHRLASQHVQCLCDLLQPTTNSSIASQRQRTTTRVDVYMHRPLLLLQYYDPDQEQNDPVEDDLVNREQFQLQQHRYEWAEAREQLRACGVHVWEWVE